MLQAKAKFCSQVLPAWLTTVLLGALLTFITYKLVVRGVITWRSETQQHHQDDEQRQPLLTENRNGQEVNASPGTSNLVLR